MKSTRMMTLMAAWLVLGCGGGQEYGQVLDRAERQNRNWDSITGIDSIRMAVGYVDRHGSANEQVRVHYLLGCAYRDAGDAMKALEAWHDAADCADTTSTDCDYGLLIRVHGQASDLFRRQLLPHEMLGELEAQRHYALRIGDMRMAINALECSADAYRLMGVDDSVITIRRRASALYEQYGFPEEAAQTLSPCIEPLVDRGDTAAARRCIERYESSRQFFQNGEPIPRKAIHYYNKGRYCLAVGKSDSAEVYFRKLLRPGLAPDKLEAGYRGLYLLYRQQGPADSMAKYAGMQYEQTIHVLAATNAESVRQMQALYSYTHLQKQEELVRAKARVRDWVIAIAIFLLLLKSSLGTVLSESSSSAPQQDSPRTVPSESKPAPVSFGRDTPLSALFREEYQGELRTVIESWRPNLLDDDPAVDALDMYTFHFDLKKIMATAVYIDLGRLLSVHALIDDNTSTLSWYLFNHSNLSTSQPTLYAQLRKYKKR